jgi:hypothetical protein
MANINITLPPGKLSGVGAFTPPPESQAMEASPAGMSGSGSVQPDPQDQSDKEQSDK